MENENIDSGFEEFAAAFDDTDDYQTDGAEDTTETEVTEEVDGEDGAEVQDDSEGGENPEDDHTSDSKEEDAEEDGQDDKPSSDQTFTIKVNKEERTVDLAEMTALAQKGADYDRVKGQLEESRQNAQSLQEQMDKYRDAMDVLELVSEQTDTPMDQLVEQLHVNLLVQNGMTEKEAKAEIRAAKAEKQVKAINTQQAQQTAAANDTHVRMQREVAEFREQFPDVDLNEELCDKLASDVRAGMSLTNAYRKMENSRKDAEIAELQRQLEAEKQNKKNRFGSPGSQRDSGGRRSTSDVDIFEKALFG